MLTTLMLPDTGSATIGDMAVVTDYKKLRQIIGYMPGRFSLYQDLSVEENLHFFATLFGTTIAAQYDLIRDIYVQIEPFKDRRAGALSGGMKQKLALCCALVHEPRVLVLDEPTTGVDPVSRHEFWMILQRLKERGITMLVSTPYMDEALLCDRIALIDQGSIMSVDTPQNIIKNFDTDLYVARSNDILTTRKQLQDHPAVERVYTFGGDLHLTLKGGMMAAQVSIPDAVIERTEPTIEDCFIRLMSV
jgi:ABC-type multidrug transport system ATPase subunit